MTDYTGHMDRRFRAAYQRNYEGPTSETEDPAKNQDHRSHPPNLKANPVIRRDLTHIESEIKLGINRPVSRSETAT